MSTLVRFGVMPQREFTSADEMKAAFQGIDRILIDGQSVFIVVHKTMIPKENTIVAKKVPHCQKHRDLYCREDDFVSWTDLHRS